MVPVRIVNCHCGCCGREIGCGIADDMGGYWCVDCWPHIKRSAGAPWDRTYLAQHGSECPFAPKGGPDGDGGLPLPIAA